MDWFFLFPMSKQKRVQERRSAWDPAGVGGVNPPLSGTGAKRSLGSLCRTRVPGPRAQIGVFEGGRGLLWLPVQGTCFSPELLRKIGEPFARRFRGATPFWGWVKYKPKGTCVFALLEGTLFVVAWHQTII